MSVKLQRKKATKSASCELYSHDDCWCMPIDLLNCHYLQTEGVKGMGLAKSLDRCCFKDLIPPH